MNQTKKRKKRAKLDNRKDIALDAESSQIKIIMVMDKASRLFPVHKLEVSFVNELT